MEDRSWKMGDGEERKGPVGWGSPPVAVERPCLKDYVREFKRAKSDTATVA